MGAGSVREVGERGQKTGYPRGQESGNEFCNIAQYFAIEKSVQR